MLQSTQKYTMTDGFGGEEHVKTVLVLPEPRQFTDWADQDSRNYSQKA